MAAADYYTVVDITHRYRAFIRFAGRFDGQPVTWDAEIVALRAPATAAAMPQPYIEVGALGPGGRRLRVGLDVASLDPPTLRKTVIMIRNYKRLRLGRVVFGERPRGRLRQVISGGQTGVDRAALDAALACGIDCGGYCPKGRRAEDGVIPGRYPLRELDSPSYAARTRANAAAADGTLILTLGPLAGGSALTARAANAAGKPCLVVDLAHTRAVKPVYNWLVAQGVRSLNVAGPRESRVPGIHRIAHRFLRRLFVLAAR